MQAGLYAPLLLAFCRILRIAANALGSRAAARAWLVSNLQVRPDGPASAYRLVVHALTSTLMTRLTTGLPQLWQYVCIGLPEVTYLAMLIHAAILSAGDEWMKAHDVVHHQMLAGTLTYIGVAYFASTGSIDSPPSMLVAVPLPLIPS